MHRTYATDSEDYTFASLASKTMGGEGLYSVGLHLLSGGGATRPTMILEPATPVVETGNLLAGFAGTVSSLSVYDPVNKEGVMAF